MGHWFDKEADISFSTLSIQSARAEVVDFTIPFIFGHSQFMMRVLGPEHNKWQIYMKPYSLLVYIFMLISVFACGFCVYIFEVRFSYHAMRNNRKLTLVEILLYCYGAMVLQARPRVPWCICSRVIICSYWIACISLAAVYCGSLVANMAITHKDKIYFDTLEDLVAQSVYKWGYLGGGYWDVVFKTSRLRVYNKIYDGTHEFYKTDPDVLAFDPEVHIQKVKNEKYVFISGSSLLNRKHCEDYRFVLSPDKFLEDKMAFALPKDSPLTEIFSKRLMQLIDRGVIPHITQKHVALDNCSERSFLRKEPLSIEDVQSAFYILILGVALSSLTLFVECVIYNM